MEKINSPRPTHARDHEATPTSEQDLITEKRYVASAKLWSKKLGGEIGPSWMKALEPIFKEPFFTEVLHKYCILYIVPNFLSVIEYHQFRSVLLDKILIVFRL